MENNKKQDSYSYNLKLIADGFNKLSDYEKYIKTNQKYLDNIYETCLEHAKRGGYSMYFSASFRYDNPNKEYLVEYFRKLGFKAELYEPGLIKGEKAEPSEDELRRNPFRYYMLMLDWNQ